MGLPAHGTFPRMAALVVLANSKCVDRVPVRLAGRRIASAVGAERVVGEQLLRNPRRQFEGVGPEMLPDALQHVH